MSVEHSRRSLHFWCNFISQHSRAYTSTHKSNDLNWVIRNSTDISHCWLRNKEMMNKNFRFIDKWTRRRRQHQTSFTSHHFDSLLTFFFAWNFSMDKKTASETMWRLSNSMHVVCRLPSELHFSRAPHESTKTFRVVSHWDLCLCLLSCCRHLPVLLSVANAHRWNERKAKKKKGDDVKVNECGWILSEWTRLLETDEHKKSVKSLPFFFFSIRRFLSFSCSFVFKVQLHCRSMKFQLPKMMFTNETLRQESRRTSCEKSRFTEWKLLTENRFLVRAEKTEKKRREMHTQTFESV